MIPSLVAPPRHDSKVENFPSPFPCRRVKIEAQTVNRDTEDRIHDAARTEDRRGKAAAGSPEAG